MKVSFKIRLEKSIHLVKNRHPVVLQTIFNRKVRKKRTGYSAKVKNWDFTNHKYADDLENAEEKNQRLKGIVLKAENTFKRHFSDMEFNYKKFIQLFSESSIDDITVIQFCNQVRDKFLQNGQANSSNDYKYLANAIRKVSPYDLYFSEFTIEWLYKFEDYHNAKGTRCYNYMKLLRALFNKAIHRKIADYKSNPFKNPYTNPYGYEFNRLKKLRISKANPERIKDLSKEQLLCLKDYHPKTEKEAKYLAIWFFSFYTFGTNLLDIAGLQWSHIKDSRWHYRRSKTGSRLKNGKPLLPEAMEILVKYDTGKKYVFDILNGYDQDELTKINRVRYYSKYIWDVTKRVSEWLGFDGYFTFYSARYTSATLALNEGADRNTVSHLLDHENFSTIDNYVGRADDKKVLKAIEILRLE